VLEFVAGVVLEARRYDIDAVHFNDYFRREGPVHEPVRCAVRRPAVREVRRAVHCPSYAPHRSGSRRTLLAERERDAYPDVEICSPNSPLGRALVGAAEGEEREYCLPEGQSITVVLIRAVPYGSHEP
jgi:hypothetical protein